MKSISRHIPQRTCVACRRLRPKRELMRLVRSPDGTVVVDAGGEKVGRGAYLCQIPKCWELALKQGRLEYALHTRLTPDNREQLIAYASDVCKEPAGDRSE